MRTLILNENNYKTLKNIVEQANALPEALGLMQGTVEELYGAIFRDKLTAKKIAISLVEFTSSQGSPQLCEFPIESESGKFHVTVNKI